MKIGDIIIVRENGRLNYGMILTRGEQYDVLVFCGSTTYIKLFDKSQIFYLHEKVMIIKTLNEELDLKILELKKKIKSVRRSDYEADIHNKYLDLQRQIKTTAQNMIKSEDNIVDFENKLKAICDIKKQLFSIESDELSEARKYNGGILYQIKQIEKERSQIEYYLKAENVTRYIHNFQEEVLKEL